MSLMAIQTDGGWSYCSGALRKRTLLGKWLQLARKRCLDMDTCRRSRWRTIVKKERVITPKSLPRSFA
jgi:hypothetical protein